MCNITERYIEKGFRIGFEEGREEGMEIGLERGSITSAINIYRTELGLGDEEIKSSVLRRGVRQIGRASCRERVSSPV